MSFMLFVFPSSFENVSTLYRRCLNNTPEVNREGGNVWEQAFTKRLGTPCPVLMELPLVGGLFRRAAAWGVCLLPHSLSPSSSCSTSKSTATPFLVLSLKLLLRSPFSFPLTVSPIMKWLWARACRLLQAKCLGTLSQTPTASPGEPPNFRPFPLCLWSSVSQRC